MQEFRERHPRSWAFVVARFAPGEYLGLHLTVGLFVSLIGLWLFAGVTEDVVHHDPLTQFDVTILEWLHTHNAPVGISIFQGISWMASPTVIAPIGLGVALLLIGQRRWLAVTSWLAALGGNGVLLVALKQIIRRPRPVYASAVQQSSFSFPSGHAMGSLVVYGMLAYFLVVFWAHRRSTQVAIISGTVALVIAIGISRLYLGVHYFSDVIAGYAAAMLWLSACVTGSEIARRQRGASSFGFR